MGESIQVSIYPGKTDLPVAGLTCSGFENTIKVFPLARYSDITGILG